MSKGSQVFACRVDADTAGRIEAAILRRNTKKPHMENWGPGDFVRAALREYLQHLDRSAKQGKARAKNSPRPLRCHGTDSQDTGPSGSDSVGTEPG